MSCELYFYWRVDENQAPHAAAAMADWQAALTARHPGLQARLLRRAAASGDGGASGDGAALATLMEVYVLGGGIPPALQTKIEAEGAQVAAAWCQGIRHIEIFEPLER